MTYEDAGWFIMLSYPNGHDGRRFGYIIYEVLIAKCEESELWESLIFSANQIPGIDSDCSDNDIQEKTFRRDRIG